MLPTDDDGRVIHSPYLDLAIGLAVIFFLCSLVVSGLNEGLNWLTRVRAKFLWAYLHDLFDGNRDKALPQGWGGIANLWGKRNDVRPDVGTASLGRPTTPADWLHEVVAALDPIDAPQLRRGSKSGPRRTAIHHVPSASLAQAIVEVLTDVGRDDVLHSVATVLDPKTSDAAAATSISTLAALIDGTAAATVTAAMGAFRTAVLKTSNFADDDRRTALAAPAEELVTQLRTLVDGNALVGFATAWVDCASAGAKASDGQRRAATDALMHAFPGNFARQRIENALASLGGNIPLYRTMRRLWESAMGNLVAFRTGLEGYFDGEMQRLSGYYRRSIRIVMFGLAIVVAGAGQVDTFATTRALWRNPEGRAQLVREGDQLVNAPSTAPTRPSAPAIPTGNAAAAPTPTGLAAVQRACEARVTAMTTSAPPGVDVESVADMEAKIRSCVSGAIDRVTGLGVVDQALVVNASAWAGEWFKHSLGRNIEHLLGVLLTALAIFKGAPFWFDIIKRLVGFRKSVAGET